MANLIITPEMVLELFDPNADFTEYSEEKPSLYVGRDGWTAGMVGDLPGGLPTHLAGCYRPGEVIHGGPGPTTISREAAMSKFTTGIYTIPFEDGTVREPEPTESPEVTYPAYAEGPFDPALCWWFDANTAELMAKEHEDARDPHFSVRRTAGGRYVELEHAEEPDIWAISYLPARSLTPQQAAEQLFSRYPHISDDTDPEKMTALLASAFELGRMMAVFKSSVKVPAIERGVRNGAHRIAHARQQFVDAGELAELVRQEVLPAIRALRADAVRDLVRELKASDTQQLSYDELLPEAAELLGVSVRTATEMFKHG